MKLQYRLTIFISIIIFFIIGIIGFSTYIMTKDGIETQMGNNTMDIAVTIASMDTIQQNIGKNDGYSVIQQTIEEFRGKTRFQYIIVMDMNGIKYSYPRGKSLGKKYNDGGEEKVLKNGEAYISKDKNVLISAIRAFVPITYNNKQVGAVLVGLLTDTVYKELRNQMLLFWVVLILGLIIGIIGAAILADIIKKTIFGLEPQEIALLLGQHDIIFQSLKSGIIAIDKNGKIILFNRKAKNTFNLNDEDIKEDISILNSNYGDQMKLTLEKKVPMYNQEVKLSHERTLLCSHTLLKNSKDEIIGVVSSFEDLTKVKKMAEELTGAQIMTSALRSQSHEFLNKLHTISGLLQLKEYDSAIKYVSDISHQRMAVSEVLNNKIRNPHVSGLLLAKYNKAIEAKISMEIDKNSILDEIPKGITVDELCSVIGNLIENSIDELVKQENGNIYIKISSDTSGLNIKVQDNGPGISDNIINKIYEPGFTTKPGNRGLGLSIVKQIIDYAHGSISISKNNGTCWEIFIPV